MTEWHRQAGKPLMLTEWSFPALDAGLPCLWGGGMRVDTEAQRARCFTHFQRVLFGLPFMVGSNMRYQVGQQLAPGERVTKPGPLAFFFPLSGSTRDSYEQAARRLATQVVSGGGTTRPKHPSRP